MKLLLPVVQPEQHTFIIRGDNALGISKENKEDIHPFYQAMDNKPGTGIGLSIVKSIGRESHNGNVLKWNQG